MASYVLLRLRGSGILRSPPTFSPYFFGVSRMLSAAAMSSSSVVNPSPPWLMLPPKAGEDIVYKFYNLSEDRVESFGVKLPDDDAVLVGSSHGWLAYFNHRNNQVFLKNPLSGRQLKLPPIDTLPNPEMNLRNGCGTLSKLILSCSPDDEEQECRAMISFGPGDRLAFCLPGRSAHWAPIGDLFFEEFPADNKNPPELLRGRAYEDFVYCSRRKLFTCITEFKINLERWRPYSPTELEDWDLGGGGDHRSRSRVCYWFDLLTFEEAAECEWFQQFYKLLLAYCIQIPYLVYAEHNSQLYILSRFIEDNEFNPTPQKTFGFSVLKVGYVGNGGVAVSSLRVADSLDGLAMFVGMNHSFAVPADKFGLNPNSIYYTDANTRLTNPSDVRSPYRHRDIDMGIFDYENKTLSPCCPFYDSYLSTHSMVPIPRYDFSSQNLATPVWFTPSRANPGGD